MRTKITVAHVVAVTSREGKAVGAAFDSIPKEDRCSLPPLKQKLNDYLWFCRGEVKRIRGGETCLGLAIEIVNGFNSHANCDQLVRAGWSTVVL